MKCASEADATKVAQLQLLLEGINQRTATREEVASLFLKKPHDDRIDINDGPYYPVAVGFPVAVFHDWFVVFRNVIVTIS